MEVVVLLFAEVERVGPKLVYHVSSLQASGVPLTFRDHLKHSNFGGLARSGCAPMGGSDTLALPLRPVAQG